MYIFVHFFYNDIFLGVVLKNYTNMPASATYPERKNKPSVKDWLPVISLAIAAFVFNTTEFAPIGLLSDIAKDLKVSEAHAGLLITIYAWVVAIASLPLILICGKIERRKLLCIIFILFIVSHFLSFFSTNYVMLMISRIGVACAHSIFWSIASPLAVRVAPEGHKSTALSLIAAGSSIAMILGLPLGRTIGLYLGWRVTFLCVAIVAILVMIVLLRLLPTLQSNNSGSIKSLPVLLKRPALMWLFVLTAIIITAHFTGYSYIEPFMNDVAKLDSDFATFTLLLFGLAGFVGSIIFSRYNDKHPIWLMTASIISIAISLFLLYPSIVSSYSLIGLCVFWGICIMIIGLIFQSKVIELAPDATAVAMSIYSGIYNVGIGGGALIGGIVSTHLSLQYIGVTGGAIALLALALYLVFMLPLLKKKDPFP